jgi:hypothetical protein
MRVDEIWYPRPGSARGGEPTFAAVASERRGLARKQLLLARTNERAQICLTYTGDPITILESFGNPALLNCARLP